MNNLKFYIFIPFLIIISACAIEREQDYTQLVNVFIGTEGEAKCGSYKYFGYRFSGYINIPDDAIYTFYLKSNDGSRLFIDDVALIENDANHGAIEEQGAIALQKGFHQIEVRYFQCGGGRALKVSYSADKMEKQEIPPARIFIPQTDIQLPGRGICAHRGANETHPENTRSAFREAIRLGAQMIEFDVRLTSDKKLIIMHDKTVDRTTNGSGAVSDLTLEEIRSFDAGSWKSEEFKGEKVPTFKETLEMMPQDIWLNIHLKGDEELGAATAKVLVAQGRIHQGVIACGSEARRGVRKINPNIMICNMDRQGSREDYIEETIKGKFSFIQLLKKRDDDNLKNDIATLKQNHVKINYYFGDTVEDVKYLFDAGVDFILTNRLSEMQYSPTSVGRVKK